MHQTLNPDVLIVAFSGRGKVPAMGKPYNQRYISVGQMKDGKILVAGGTGSTGTALAARLRETGIPFRP